MQHKKLTTLGCLLVLGAFVVPGAMAHYDNGTHPTPYATTGLVADDYTLATPPAFAAGDNPGLAGNPGFAMDLDRVSGWYYGSAGPYVQSTDDSATLTLLSAFGGMLCDIEVLAGTISGTDTNEEKVDGVDSGAPGGTPDGVFNDGGNGGACHVGSGQYGVPDWETDGCVYDNALAEDAVFGSEVWISTSCDYETPQTLGGPGPDAVILSATTCAVNSVLPPTTPGDLVGCAGRVTDCVDPALIDPATDFCSGSVTGTFCGADSVADATEFGEGDGASTVGATGYDIAEEHAPSDLVDTDGVPFPNSGGVCPSDEVAAVFVWTSVAVHVDSAGGVGHTADEESFLENAAAGTYGWIS